MSDVEISEFVDEDMMCNWVKSFWEVEDHGNSDLGLRNSLTYVVEDAQKGRLSVVTSTETCFTGREEVVGFKEIWEDGKIPVLIDLVKSEVSGGKVVSALNFSIATDISSQPRPVEAANFRAVCTSAWVTGEKEKGEMDGDMTREGGEERIWSITWRCN